MWFVRRKTHKLALECIDELQEELKERRKELLEYMQKYSKLMDDSLVLINDFVPQEQRAAKIDVLGVGTKVKRDIPDENDYAQLPSTYIFDVSTIFSSPADKLNSIEKLAKHIGCTNVSIVRSGEGPTTIRYTLFYTANKNQRDVLMKGASTIIK